MNVWQIPVLVCWISKVRKVCVCACVCVCVCVCVYLCRCVFRLALHVGILRVGFDAVLLVLFVCA